MKEEIERRSFRSRKKGFTLIEMMLVMALLMLIAGFAVVKLGGFLGGGQRDAVALKIKSFETALFKYKMDTGSFPSTEAGLTALLDKPANDRGRWRGPYIEKRSDIIDVWDNELRYRFPSSKVPGGYELYSLGEDQTESEDDIRSWEL